MKRKYLVLTVALVLILAITALGCTAQQRTEYETYTVTDENGSTTYYINENGKWQDSNGNLGTYTEEDGTIVFFDMDGKQMANAASWSFSSMMTTLVLLLRKPITDFASYSISSGVKGMKL